MLDREDRVVTPVGPNADVNRMYGARLANRIADWHTWRRHESTAHPLRPNQQNSFEKAPAFFRSGKLRAIVKKPPASGKTTEFAGFIAAIEESALVLISGKSLRTDTIDTIRYEIAEAQKRPDRSAARKAPTVYLIIPGEGGKTTTEQVRTILQTHKLKSDKFVIVITYQGALTVGNADAALFDRLLDCLGLLVFDESHRGLGDKTKHELQKANREGFQDSVSACLRFLTEDSGVKKRLAGLFEQNRQGSEEVSPLHRALRLIVNEVSRGHFLDVQGAARDAKLTRQTQLLLAAIEDERAEPSEELSEGDESAGAPSEITSGDDLYAFLTASLERLAEGSLEEIIERRQRPIAHLYVTATPELAVKNVAKTYGAEVLNSATFTDIEAEGTIIIPRRIGVGEAVYRTDKTTAKTSVSVMAKLAADGKFIMRDGRSVMEAVASCYVDEWKKHHSYLPAIGRCSSIAEAEAVTKYLCGLGPKAVRCTSGNGKYPEGLNPDEAKRRLQLAPAHPERIDVVVTVSQVGEGWNVPTLRCALMFAFVRNCWQVIQFIGRIMRELEEGSPLPPKSLEDTCIIEPDWMVEAAKPKADDIEPPPPGEPEEPGSGEGTDKGSGTGKARESTPSSVHRHPNSLAMLVEADEVEASTAILRGLDRAVRITFNPQNLDDVRVLLGSISTLIHNGSPVNIKGVTFQNEQFNWKVSSERLIHHLCPDAGSGTDAALQLAVLLWPKEAKLRIFDRSNPEHIKALLRSPGSVMRKGVLSLEAFYRACSCPDRGWDFGRRELATRCFGESGGLPKLRELVVATWGAEKTKKQPSRANIPSWAKLADTPENLVAEGFYTRVFEYKNWKLVGWLMAEAWAPVLNFPDDRVEVWLARHFFPDWTPPVETVAAEPREAIETKPAAPKVVESVFGNFRCPLPAQATYIQAGGDFMSVAPPERDIDFPDVLVKLLATRYLPKPGYLFHPFPGKGKTAVACFCRVLDYEWVMTGSDERVAKQWAARAMVNTLLEKKPFTLPRFDFGENLIELEARSYSVKDQENREFVKNLHRVVGLMGMRIPIGFLTNSTVNVRSESEPEFTYTVHIIVGDYRVIGHGPTPFSAYGAAARLAVRRIECLDFSTLSDAETEEIVSPDSASSYTLSAVDTARMELKIRCSHDLNYPIVLLDERTKRDPIGWIGDIRMGDLRGSGVSPMYREAVSRAHADLLQKIGGPYRAAPVMPGREFADASRQPALLREALSDPRGTLQKYLQTEFAVHTKYVVSPHGDDGQAFCEVRVPLMVNDVRLFGIVDPPQVQAELDLLSLNCLRMLVDHQALRGRRYSRRP